MTTDEKISVALCLIWVLQALLAVAFLIWGCVS
jgi:hypothetical protein